MKDGDKLIQVCRLVELEELVKIKEEKAKELRLQIWLNEENIIK